jgi:hypothetical protein
MTVGDFFYFLWPWQRKSATLNPDDVFAGYGNSIDVMEAVPLTADDEKLLAQSWKLFDNETARRTSIDTRAAAIMSAIGLAATLVTGVGFTVLKDVSIPSIARVFILMGYVLSLVYLVRTMLLLFQVHGDVPRYTPDPSDLVTGPLPPAAPGAPILSPYDRRLACKIMRYTVNNYKINNMQADALFVAQRAFRNAILAIVLGGSVAVFLIFLNTWAPAVPPCAPG